MRIYRGFGLSRDAPPPFGVLGGGSDPGPGGAEPILNLHRSDIIPNGRDVNCPPPQVIREMEATVQFKKYRAMRRRYGEGMDDAGEASRIGKSIRDMLKQG